MEFQEVVRKRRMVRSFQTRAVPPEVLEVLLENALHAPSAGFSQGWAFLVLESAEARDTFWETAWPEERTGPYASMTGAPVIIIPLANKQAYLDRYAEPDKGWTDKREDRWPVPFWYIDTGFASLLMLLTAVDQGLVSVFIGVPNPGAVREAFGVPEEYMPIGAIPLGYGAPDTPSPSLKRGRRPVAEVVHRNTW